MLTKESCWVRSSFQKEPSHLLLVELPFQRSEMTPLRCNWIAVRYQIREKFWSINAWSPESANCKSWPLYTVIDSNSPVTLLEILPQHHVGTKFRHNRNSKVLLQLSLDHKSRITGVENSDLLAFIHLCSESRYSRATWVCRVCEPFEVLVGFGLVQ